MCIEGGSDRTHGLFTSCSDKNLDDKAQPSLFFIILFYCVKNTA